MTALIVLAILIFLAVLLLVLPIHGFIEYGDELKITVRYIFLKYAVKPGIELEGTKKKDSGKKETKESSPGKKKTRRKISMDQLTFYLEKLADYLPKLGKGLRHIFSKIKVDDTELYIQVSADDPYKAALRYGQVNAAVYSAYAALDNLVQMKRTDIRIKPDLMQEGWDFYLSSHLRISAGSVLRGGFILAAPLVKTAFSIWRKGRKAKKAAYRKAKENEATNAV